MTPVVGIKDKRAIQEAAALWIITMDNRPLVQEEQARLRAWLLASASHRKEFIDLARVWGQLDLLASYALDITDADIAETIKETTTTTTTSARRPYTKHWQGYAAAAALAFCVLGVVFVNHSPDVATEHASVQSTGVTVQEFATAIGELRDLTLSDGSVIKLNTNTRINIQLGAAERRIDLLQGEANFVVAKDASRPFVVYTPKGSVTAVGTAFNIRVERDEANVLVTEGVVRVNPQAQETSAHTRPLATKARDLVAPLVSAVKVSAGHRVQMSAHHTAAINKVEKKLLAQELAWHSGMLSFDNTPLQDVIAEVSRYTSMKIVIDEPEIARMPVGGYFKAGEISAMLEVLQLSFGIKVTQLSGSTILLSGNTALNKSTP